jgi:penicillin-binding protein 1A
VSAVRTPARDPRTILADHRQRRARGRRRRRWVVVWLVMAAVVSLACFGAGLLAAPIDYNFQPVPPKAVQLVDEQGHVFATIEPPQQQKPVTSSQIPAVVKQAFVAAEDQRFYSENGVDPIAILRATWSDITGGTFSGASTITQQYVKDVYSGTESTRTPLRKLREAALAIRLDSHLSKDEILTRYLNNVYLGNGAVGIQAACLFYFGEPVTRLGVDRATGKSSDSLALARATTLAGIVPAPSVWNPVADPHQARARQIYVLNRLVSDGTITAEQASAALGKALPAIVAKTQAPPATIAPQFRDLVYQQLRNQYDADELFRTGGMRVTTTLDSKLQQAAVEAIGQVLPKATDPEAAVVAIDPRNGDIRAIATRQVPAYKALGFDVADPPQAVRSSGSTIKPFTLAVALQHGHTLGEIHDAPQCIQVAPGYSPCNAEPAGGVYTLETALAASVNTIYAPLGVQVGLKRVIRLARRAGMKVGHAPGCHPICDSEALGVPTTPLSEADAYGTFVNGGIHHAPRTILAVADGAGELSPPAVRGKDDNRVMPAAVADEVKQAMAEVVTSGTGRAALQPFPVYGKTGTTSNYRDAWFTGCTPTLCLSVWTGYNDGKSMYHDGAPVFGGTLPAQIFAKVYADERAGVPTATASPPASTPPP